MGFLPALNQLGDVVRVTAPETEVDAFYDAAQAEGQDCIFLCFAPPHFVPITLRCPTIPVFAWEFSTIPCEMWSADPRSDWRTVFRHSGRAITLSRHTAALVQAAMGPDYPVFAIPVAAYDAFAPLFEPQPAASGPRRIRFRGILADSDVATPQPAEMVLTHTPPPPPPEAPVAAPPVSQAAGAENRRRGPRERLSLTIQYGLGWYRDVVRDLLPRGLKSAISAAGRGGYRFYRVLLPLPAPPAPAAAPPLPEHEVQLEGIVYVALLAAQDGRKNWHDLLTGFLWAFREEKRATLILKMPQNSRPIIEGGFNSVLSRFAPFACRVLVIYGYLEDAEYAALIRAADFYVNASYCEGLSIPLMEFLAAGKPVIAPDHTALADYITPSLAFIVHGTPEHNVWPFDPRELFTTMRYRIDWTSLEQAYRDSFATALNQPARYAAMAQAGHAAMRDYCSVERVRHLLAQALQVNPQAAPAPEAAEPALSFQREPAE